MAKIDFGGTTENVVTRKEFSMARARKILKQETIAIIGYGVQGPAQALNLKDNGFLDHTSPSPQGWGYAVFGKVTDGMDAVSTIERVKTGSSHGHQDVPTEDVVITKVTIVE